MAKKKAATEKQAVVKQLGGAIARTNCFFIQLKAYGNCDENGRTVMGIEFSTKKIIAPPDAPLKLIRSMLESMMNGMTYSDKDAAIIDIEEFKQWANTLQVE